MKREQCYGLPWWLTKASACQYSRHRLDPWVRKIPWRTKWQPTPVFLPGESHGQRSLAGYIPWGCIELDTTDQLNHPQCYGEGKPGGETYCVAVGRESVKAPCCNEVIYSRFSSSSGSAPSPRVESSPRALSLVQKITLRDAFFQRPGQQTRSRDKTSDRLFLPFLENKGRGYMRGC